MAGSRRSKYGAVKTTVDGIQFDSKAESRRYAHLKLLERAGEITDLQLQPVFELAPSVKYKNAKRATPALRYCADFCYVNRSGEKIFEDCKGMINRVYLVKKHLVMAKFGIEIVEVK